MPAEIFLIPTVLSEERTEVLPAYVTEAVKQCSVFFVENERTARRFLKRIWKEMVIDDYAWHNMKELKSETQTAFRRSIRDNKIIGILSEAGCPGIADPGQQLVQIAQEMNVRVRPFVGPSSILLALMASGMNGQHFQFHGYLPIDQQERTKTLQSLESQSRQKRCTQIFIETPYRNNQLLESILRACHPQTRLCVAVDLTDESEMVKTKTVQDWKQELPQLHKRPAIFLLEAN
jgi:16S rRNA (cytidine1402-2'-O)-methyltransferase